VRKPARVIRAQSSITDRRHAVNRIGRYNTTGKDFVLLASDQSAGRSIIKMKSDENKIRQLSPSLCMAYGGEPGKQIERYASVSGFPIS
jgi:20S proteasome alpha/beta subunit